MKIGSYAIGLVLSITLITYGCKQESAKTPEAHLGEVELQVSGAEAAQPHFEKGLLLLHSFEYDDARTAFRKAQEVDPEFVMAYWGEAMTHNHALWRNQAKEDALTALNKIDTTRDGRLAKAQTELERDFLEAAEILYGEGEKNERDQAYSEHMAKLHQKYPDNHEIAAFYALSLLGAVPVGRDEAIYEKGARIAQGILKENPNHPGALHYLIHSYDDPGHAGLAINAANSYSKVAPDAAHALHMPSHIYVAMGMWNEVVTSNIASWNASVNRMIQKELDLDAQSYHALHWLQYGYLQKGMKEEARQIMQAMIAYTDSLPSKRARAYLADMKGTYLVETGDWDDQEMADIPVDLEDLNIAHRAVFNFVEGEKALLAGNSELLQETLDRMKKEREQALLLVNNDGIPMCSGAGYPGGSANQLDIDQAHVLELELKALQAWTNKDQETTEQLLQQAIQLEESISYAYGPPPIVQPSFELYGNWLLEVNRPQDALAQFEKALKKGPKRTLALKGKLEAAQQTGDEAMISEVTQLLDEVMAELPEYKGPREQLSTL